MTSPATEPDHPQPPEHYARFRLRGIFIGFALFFIPLILPPPDAMPQEAWHVLAIVMLMAVWWVTEAVPIAVTALVPLALAPLLGLAPISDVAAPYANPLVYMMLGGFMIGLAMQRSNLHRRIALTVLCVAGRKPDHLVGGFMLATAFLSMWISNTATAAMMLPIGLSVIGLLQRDENFAFCGKAAENLPVALLLGIAFGAGIGGMGTLIGTPPNAVLAGFVNQYAGLEIGFAKWMLLGVPTAVLLLLCAWLILTKLVFPVGRDDLTGTGRLIEIEQQALGKMQPAEIRVAVIFCATALAWMFRPLIAALLPEGIELTDAGIAIIAAIALFLTPEHKLHQHSLLEWGSTRDLPWNVMVLIGGGLSLGVLVQGSGLADWVGLLLTRLDVLPLVLLALLCSGFALLVSHITSNTATAATLVPIAVSLAVGTGAPPLMIAIPMVMACSCAFMLPVATPPNAIIYGSNMIHVAQMAKAGALIGLAALAIITLMVFTLGQWLFGGR